MAMGLNQYLRSTSSTKKANQTRVVMARHLTLVGILPAVAYAGTPVVYSGCYGGTATTAGPTVIVPNVGKVEGLDMASCGYPTVNEFRGVPYAQPPVRSLRFQPPQAHPGWGDEVTFKATAYGSSCMQPNDGRFYSDLKMNEDCLFLNIAAPKAALEIGAKALPVMLNIHGGKFQIGMGNQPDIQGPSLVASSENKVVAVAINYRLGVFGFLGGSSVMALRNGGAAESLGIQDQRAAIAWVKANIGAFGGDGGDITLFGESAGGVSILYHLVQPASFHLYKNAIVESGTFLTDMRTMAEAETVYEDVLKANNCTYSGIACLLEKDANTLLDASDVASGGDWHPVGSDTPAALIAAKRYNSKAAVLVGSSSDEAAVFHGAGAGLNPLLTEAELDNMKPYLEMQPETLNELKRIYSPEAYPYPADLGGYSIWHWMHVRYMTDRLNSAGACSVRWLAQTLVAGGSPAVYTYLFAYPPKFHPASYNGVFANHGTIVPFVNGDLTPLSDLLSIPEDRVPSEAKSLAHAMGSYWSSFATSSGGVVAGEGLVTWPMFTTEGDKVLKLDVESAGGIKVQEGLRKAACDWQTEQAQDWLPSVASSAKDATDFNDWMLPNVRTACLDVTVSNDPGCHGNVTWAMQTGIYEYPLWYTEYPALSMFASFKDFQNVLAQKVSSGNGTAAGNGWNCPFPCNYNVPSCFDVVPSSPGQCYQNALWAKSIGLILHPEWYSEFPGLTVNSSLSDFQYVLHTKLNTGNGWQCPLPCTSSFLVSAKSAPSAAPTFMATSSTATSSTPTITTTTTIASSSHFPWWCWLLLLLLFALCVVAAAASRAYFSRKGKQKPKRTRATPSEMVPLTHQVTDPEQPAGRPTQQFTPVPTAQITRGYALPAYPVAAVPVTHNLFNQIDTNRDGVITRDEYARFHLFNRLDTNHDGVLTRDEFARWRQ